ncbi:HAD-IA family hydrolase [Streptomyces iconiensis]|uniref:HAD-IA family hydrolase n=1 Tax=Streptomyces iconiensis TaxID=1384038 RepID=A0ABT7A0D8_9ACTN|nr:HAD-IA family hydrolase [Streptomyces iconiensis]MDJ1134547.1 HAD-IA family hydrolase [Streptomyces iconiensis]
MNAPPQAVAFDVLETLMDLDSLGTRFEEIGRPAALLQPWFLRVQRDCMALALSGPDPGFFDVARQALHTESGQSVTDEEITHVLDGFAELPAHPDAEPAMRRLRGAGVRVGCLTVGEAAPTWTFLERTGLAPHVEHVVTAGETGTWKPAPGVYRTAAERMNVAPDRMALVAVHAWDCHGAKRAGCVTGWCDRLERIHADVFLRPDVTGRDLTEVADRLLALSSG